MTVVIGGGLIGKRILIVEDEYFIAADLGRALASRDAVVLGPAADLDSGMALIDSESIDVAVLDVNLAGKRSFPLADRLAKQSVPYLFVTGYDGWALPDSHRHAPRVAKPFAIDSIIAEIERLCATST